MRLALKRADFNTFSGETLRGLFEDSDFCDVTLVCSDGRQILAHKAVLSAGSEFFNKLLKQNKHAHPLVYLHSLPQYLVLPLVGFVYLGACEVEQEAIESFLKTATILGVKGLMAQASEDQKKKESFDEQETEALPTETRVSSGSDTVVDKEEEKAREASSGEKIQLKDQNTIFENVSSENPVEVKTEICTDSSKANAGKCDQCSYHGKTFWYLNRHIKAVHEGLKYACQFCSYKVTDQTVFNTHLREVHNINKLVCNLCNYKCNKRGQLQAHIRDEHETSNFDCNLCEYKTTCEAFLNVHRSKEHEGISLEQHEQETGHDDSVEDLQRKTIVRRQRVMEKFQVYVSKETGGKTLADIVDSKDGREIMFELVFCYFSTYKNSDGSGPSRPTLDSIRSNIKQSLLDQFGINIMEGSKAQARWKNLMQA